MEQPTSTSAPGGIALSAQDIEHLGKAARWAKTVSILGFVMLGFMLVFGTALWRLPEQDHEHGRAWQPGHGA
jgi:type IV secretory pathway VirB2 component (pilin)